MDLYSIKSKSTGQKSIIILVQLLLIAWSFRVIFLGDTPILESGITVMSLSIILIFIFNILTFVRFLFTLFIFINRKIPMEEVFSVPMAFALYYVGFTYLAVASNNQTIYTVVVGIILFCIGCYFNSYSEWQRYVFKKDGHHKGMLYTDGLFGLSRHPNFFGDVLWVSGYAVMTANIIAAIIPIILGMFFYFYNIPLQEKHMVDKYKEPYEHYMQRVKKLIPFIC